MRKFFQMSSQKKPQIVVLLAALFLVVLLIVAPRIPQEAEEKVTEESKSAVDPVENEINKAVALVQGGENPMQGIMILREILEEDPDNIEAHWHLAHFSVQSGQYDKAVERFKKVIDLDDDQKFPDASFYLGKTYATLDQKEEAIASFEQYLAHTEDSTVKERVEVFIRELKN